MYMCVAIRASIPTYMYRAITQVCGVDHCYLLVHMSSAN